MKDLLCFMFLLPLTTGCGAYDSGGGYKKPATAKPGASLVEKSCNTCHGKTVGQAFPDSLPEYAKKRVRNNTMPPGGGLDDDTKSKLLGE